MCEWIVPTPLCPIFGTSLITRVAQPRWQTIASRRKTGSWKSSQMHYCSRLASRSNRSMILLSSSHIPVEEGRLKIRALEWLSSPSPDIAATCVLARRRFIQDVNMWAGKEELLSFVEHDEKTYQPTVDDQSCSVNLVHAKTLLIWDPASREFRATIE